MDGDDEKLGFDTQKPIGLLSRIINTSSDIYDIVFDHFFGCGTTIEASEFLKRHWIGIDITHLSISLISIH